MKNQRSLPQEDAKKGKIMNNTEQRKYISIEEVQQQYLPISKKKLRAFVKKYLNIKVIGNRIYIERQALEDILSDPDRDLF